MLSQQRTYLPEKDPKQYNALERVAVLSDEIADGVRDNGRKWRETPYIPGRSRFRMMYKGEEIIKPLRKTMKKLAQEIHNDPAAPHGCINQLHNQPAKPGCAP